MNAIVLDNFNNKFAIGGEYSQVSDVGSSATGRNDGMGWMIGGAYFLTKSVYFYAALQKSDWASNETFASGSRYAGTAAGFNAAASKLDAKYTRFGMVKEF